jgi:hypothetical protein
MSGRSNARKMKLDGYTFDSQMEAARYQQLKLLEFNGDIYDLEIHPLFPMIHNGQKICAYEADFVYYENDKRIIEDVKGHRTEMYKLKKKMMKIFYDIDILETQ